MHTDIALGLVTFAMAALGGVVSAHAPTKPRQKWLYALMFMLLGAVGLYFVIQQSHETAKASSDLSTSIHDLSESSKETTRLQTLNTALQQKLLEASGNIVNLSKQNLDQITGGDSYPVIIASLRPDQQGAMTLSVVAHGKNNLVDLTINVMSHMQRRDDPQWVFQQLMSPQALDLPMVPVNRALQIPITIHPEGVSDVYQINSSARNGSFVEILRINQTASGLQETYEVRNSSGRVLDSQPKR